MPAYKDGDSGTWRSQFYYTDWTGKRHKKNKRGFKTKREAQQFEAEFTKIAKADMDMKLSSFVEIYLKDKEVELKQRTLKNKRYMIITHVIPYLGDKKMNEISAADIIAWQKEIKEKNEFSEAYLRMLQNQVTAIFIHASKIYYLKDNPCKRVKKMGRSDDRSLTFWTLTEYQKFISTFDKQSMHYVMFELLFWTGMREGELLALTRNDFDIEQKKVKITVYSDRLVHTARRFSACFPLIQCTSSGHQCIAAIMGFLFHFYPAMTQATSHGIADNRFLSNWMNIILLLPVKPPVPPDNQLVPDIYYC